MENGSSYLQEAQKKVGIHGGTNPIYRNENSGHSNSFEVGNEFQDFVCIELAKYGIILQNINSKKFQFEVGENLQGFEIKYDGRFADEKPTQRLSIEVAEKTKSENANYIPSGIFRSDNSWLYVQGGYKCFYIFGVQILRQMYARLDKDGFPVYNRHSLPTVNKFYLPEKDADKYCVRKFDSR